ncbi:MAG: cytochrome c1 [Candidatus Puniceispirillaceae bacterium]|jgi:ubiquinol-cytochrome c reductase cytochrome c1 subunit
MKKLLCVMAAIFFASPVWAAGSGGVLKQAEWSFSGPLGTFDKASMQRGFQAYREVCSGCHSLDYIAFRNLADLGYNADEIKAIAAEYEVEDGPNDEGEMFMRTAVPADHFPAPYPNENAARAANNGAYPLDLSLIFKARPNGADYLYSLLTSYEEAPADVTVPEGMYYNAAYSGHLIAMPQPLYGDDVTYADGADSSVDAISRDLVNFLAWTAEPAMETRKRTGVAVLIFLVLLSGLSYGAMRFIWADVKK